MSREHVLPDFEWLVGSIVMARPHHGSGERRLVAILGTDNWAQTLFCALVTNEIDEATETDVVLGPRQTGLRYPISIETRLTADLWAHQASEPVGRVPFRLLNAIEELRFGNPRSAVSALRGVPLLDEEHDDRWGFRRDELSQLLALGSDCAGAHERLATAVPTIDPTFLECAHHARRDADVDRAMALLADGLAKVPSEAIPVGAVLAESRQCADLHPGIMRLTTEPSGRLVGRRVTTLEIAGSPLGQLRRANTHPSLLAQAIVSVSDSNSSETGVARILTSRKFWSHNAPEFGRPLLAMTRADRYLVQLESAGSVAA
jgi:hypothetical protein